MGHGAGRPSFQRRRDLRGRPGHDSVDPIAYSRHRDRRLSGGGKTTLVNHLLRTANGLRLAILVNEFGALPIDDDLIIAREDNLISLAGGCVCCSFGSDLMAALMDLSQLSPPPERVLIEASGVAMPGAIAASVDC